ncbi:MAG: hypothetical protein HN995_00085 [Candidatus Marinimicrobia bacterium]|jgi:hypothetical protein|nr:hypothetical protein [Candidatus Neomarinimicrobiota bacterium]MBT3575328.1 hypothetical protein [Candidatus Neomarinimicrobiota bacterium]MBT3680932.1 hypothetical protein [Candidatus Neomarinimicrobiota bacterium]MBT3949543.1 hypothetical protein [Candidatus Neomarinimicrobiota bacterium]MBT4252947.1 hypothetical protein [Candidatus Neomarinimicrobiota bacterium]
MQTSFRLLFLLLSSIAAYSQVGTWEKIPTLTEIRTMLPLEEEVIMASDGGLLSFNKSSGLFTYGIGGETTENLDLNSTYIDSDNLLWIGARSPGPIVEVMDLNTSKFLRVEFVDLDATNSFVQVGDSVYSTYQDGLEGGLLLYRKGAEAIEYLDIFNNFPNQNTMDLSFVGDIGHVDGKLYFRTNREMVWVELDGRNLKDPVNWNVEPLPAGVPDMSRSFPYLNSVLLAAGSSIYEYNFDDYIELFSSDHEITDIHPSSMDSDILILATDVGLDSLNIQSSIETPIYSLSSINSIELFNDEIWVASSTDFLSLYMTQQYKTYSANRSRDHSFNKLMVDASNQLIGGSPNGFSIYSDLGWRTIKAGNFNSEFDENLYNWNEMIVGTLDFLGDKPIEDIVTDGNGNTFFSIQRHGVFKLDDEQPGDSKFFGAADGSLEPTFDGASTNYVLPGQMSLDSEDNVWVTTKFVREGGGVISIFSPDDSIYHIYQYQGGLESRSVKSIAIDDNDMVWLGSQVRTELQAGGGIDFLEIVGGSLHNDMEINVSHLTTDSPLASNEILQLEVDTHNTLWILTPAGVQSMPLPDRWLTSSELKNHASLYMTPKETDYYFYWQLTDYNITSFEIDQRGNHWFLSDNAGVHVLQDNGRWINGGYGYNTSNSGLLDNEIYSAAFDGETGRTYLSTPKGISVLNTPFAQPKETYSSMHIYPQPFNPDIHEKVIIQGLMDNSSVRILTVQGALVKELTYLNEDVQGYEAQWDGRDEAGDKVGSGVYILFLFNDEGEASSSKLAVLR